MIAGKSSSHILIGSLLACVLTSSCAGVAVSFQEPGVSPAADAETQGKEENSFRDKWAQIDEKTQEKKAAEEAAKAKAEAPEESEVLEERRRGYKEEEPEPKSKGLRLYWDFGPRLDALDGELSIVVGGRLHLDAAEFKTDPAVEAAFGPPTPGFNVRRAFVETGGAYRKLEFNLWLNFSDFDESKLGGGSSDMSSTVDFRNVFVGVRDLPIISGVRVGYFKEPFGLEETISSNDITFMERSLTDTFVMARNLGVMLNKRFTGERRMTTALGVFREADNDLELGTGYGITGRVTAVPWSAMEGRRLIHLGLAGTYRRPNNDLLRFRSRPESAQAQYMAGTGYFRADRDMRLGLEAGLVIGVFSLQSEYILTALRGMGNVGNPQFQSGYLMSSVVLTGEHRSYRNRVGAFGAVHPTNPIFTKGSFGAWELAGRYSYLDLDSAGIQGGILSDWSLGLNGYLNDNVRLMFNYILAHAQGVGDEHIFQVRTQLSF